MFHDTRLRRLNSLPVHADGRYVLYWMQQSQRTRCNHALEYAVQQANELRKPLVVCFGLADDYPQANERHYVFMLQGLADVQANLRKRRIMFLVKHGQPHRVALEYGRQAAAHERGRASAEVRHGGLCRAG